MGDMGDMRDMKDVKDTGNMGDIEDLGLPILVEAWALGQSIYLYQRMSSGPLPWATGESTPPGPQGTSLDVIWRVGGSHSGARWQVADCQTARRYAG